MNYFGDSPGTPIAVADRKRRLRLWMVDDHAALREGFAKLLSSDPRLRVARQFDSAQPLLAALAEERPPDIVLLDLNIGKENGLSAIRPAKTLVPGVKVLMFTTFNNTFAEEEAFQFGASGFLLKSYEPHEIIELIYQSFYHPDDPRLFPNVFIRNSRQASLDPSTTTSAAAKRPGFFSALRQLCRPQRRQPVD
jgi:DNA-binding NarL/FixJ family response regulator